MNDWNAPSEPRAVAVRCVQYDGEGKWIDVELSTGATYRLDALWLVCRIIEAVGHREAGVGLVTGGGVLRWGKKDEEL